MAWVSQFIAMQIPVVLLLILQNYRVYNIFEEKAFKYFALGWLFNFIYLFLTNYGPLLSPTLHSPIDSGTISQFFNFLGGAFFWYGGRKGAGGKSRLALASLSRASFYLVCLAFYLIDLVPQRMLPSAGYPLIAVYKVPHMIFHLLALLAYAKYMRIFLDSHLTGEKSGQPLIYNGLILYALIQPISLLTTGIDNPFLVQFAPVAGFILGLASKLLIYVGLAHFFGIYLAHVRRNASEVETARKTFLRIAHELGTPIGEIIALTAILFDKTRGKLEHYLLRLDYATERITAIMRSSQDIELLEHSISLEEKQSGAPVTRHADFQFEEQSLNKLVQTAIMAVKQTRPERVEYHVQFSRGLFIRCVKHEIVQVFINILRNSVDALSHRDTSIPGPNRISVITSRRRTANEQSAEAIVIDNGPGLEASVIGHLFEEGYTTRTGLGRGHGLFIVQNLLQNHGGTISLTNIVNDDRICGCKVVITFPLVTTTLKQKEGSGEHV